MEDSSQESFQGPQLPILHKGYSYELSLFPQLEKSIIKKDNREQFPIPFLLQTSLSLSYLLHNLMSKELFGTENWKICKKKYCCKSDIPCISMEFRLKLGLRFL